MSLEEILNMLQTYGLTKTQAQIFIYLTRFGSSSIREITKALKTNRMSVYRNLKRMQNMGLINVIPGRPMKFSAIPANMALNALISMAKSRISEMENKYSQVLEMLSRIPSQQQEYALETRFRVHSGRRSVYTIIAQMLENSESEVLLLTTPNDLIRLSLYGLEDLLKKLSARMVRIKILTNISDKRIAATLRDYMKYATIKHTEIPVKTRFLIVDGKMALTSLTIDDSISLESESDQGFWTDSPHYIHSIKTFFDMVWLSAQDISIILQYLKTGKPVEKTLAFNDMEEYHECLTRMLTEAENEILIYIRRLREPCVPSNFTQLLKEASRRGVKMRILTFLDEETGDLREILDVAEVRHIEHIGINFIVIDGVESLLCFPLTYKSESPSPVQCLWSNFVGFANILSEVFMDLWLKAVSPPIRLAKIQFMRAIGEIPKILGVMAEDRGWLLEAPAIIVGRSGLSQKFDIALRSRNLVPSNPIVADFLLEESNVKAALITLHLKAMDVEAAKKILIIPKSDLLSQDEKEMVSIYGINVVEGLRADEVSQRIMEIIGE
ncbi:MAG: helix-turn-helix domain-containing protein [Candidatus Bathyarchaeia archaeon]